MRSGALSLGSRALGILLVALAGCHAPVPRADPGVPTDASGRPLPWVECDLEVVVTSDGAPLAGVTVLAVAEDFFDDHAFLEPRATTGADGVAHIHQRETAGVTRVADVVLDR